MKILTVIDHPRRDSLTHAVAARFAKGLAAGGHEPVLHDLHAAGFDPRMPPADEPDWQDIDKKYSATAEAEMARIRAADALVLVFPVWWWGLPAMSKGWIDRVFNRGFAYDGDRALPVRTLLFLGVAGSGRATYEKNRYDLAGEIQILHGIGHYCGVADTRLEYLYDSLGDAAAIQAILLRAEALGRDFAPAG